MSNTRGGDNTMNERAFREDRPYGVEVVKVEPIIVLTDDETIVQGSEITVKDCRSDEERVLRNYL